MTGHRGSMPIGWSAGERPIEPDDGLLLQSIADREQQRLAAIAAGKKAAAPVVEELRQAGFDVIYIEDLYQKKLQYAAAIPVLLKWLPQVHVRNAKWQIVTALGVRWAKPVAAAPLIREFRADPSLRWEIADMLCRVADASVLDDIVMLVNDPESGTSRQMLTLCLGQINDPRSVAALPPLLRDDTVAGHAVMAAGKLRAIGLRPLIEPFLGNPKAWVRAEAKKALARIDRAVAP